MKLAEMKQRRADARKRLKTILDAITARGAEATSTEEELKAITEINDEIEKLDGDIAITERSLKNMGTETRSEDEGEGKTEGKTTLRVDVVQDNASPVFRTLGHQLIAIKEAQDPNSQVDQRSKAQNMLKEVAKRAPSGLAEMNDKDGGYLLESDKQAEIMKSNNDDSPTLADDCKVINLSSNSTMFEAWALNDASRADNYRLGGVMAYWMNEADTVSPSKPGLRKIEIPLQKIGAIGYATEELLEDASALSTVMLDGFRSAIRYEIGKAVYNGDGAKKLSGIMNCAALKTVAKRSGQAASTFIYGNALDMFSSMPASLLPGAKWYINAEVWPEIISMVIATGSSSGQTVFLPPNGVHDAPYGLLFGRPIVPIEACEALGTKGDVIFANMSAYALLKKGEARETQSTHVRFLYGETAFRVIQRIGGGPIPNSVLTPAKGTLTQSPFVTLAVRA